MPSSGAPMLARLATEQHASRDGRERDLDRDHGLPVPSITVSPSSPDQRGPATENGAFRFAQDPDTNDRGMGGDSNGSQGLQHEHERRQHQSGQATTSTMRGASPSSASASPRLQQQMGAAASTAPPSSSSCPTNLAYDESTSRSLSSLNTRVNGGSGPELGEITVGASSSTSAAPGSGSLNRTARPASAAAAAATATSASATTTTSRGNQPNAGEATGPSSGFSFSSFLPSLSNMLPRLTSTPTLHLVTSTTDEVASARPDAERSPPLSPDENSPTYMAFNPNVTRDTSIKRGRNDSTAFLRNLPGHLPMHRPQPAVVEEDDEEGASSPGGVDRRQSVDLDINEATANGETRALDGSSSTREHPGRGLSRHPSAAFMAASRGGQVNPLTLQAVARQANEDEALKLVREREDRERQFENESVDGVPPKPNTLVRKSSWTAALATSSYVGGAPVGHSRSLSQDHNPKASRSRQSSNNLDSVHESGSATESTVSRSGDATLRSTGNKDSTSTGEFGQASGAVAGSDQTVQSNSSKKRGFFSRLGGGNRSRAMTTLSIQSNDSALSHSSLDSPSPRSPAILEVPASIDAASGTAGKKDLGPEKVRLAKVKTKGKTSKDFGKLFLAQELCIPSPSNAPSSSTGKFGRGRSDTLDSTSTHSHDDNEAQTSPDEPSSGSEKSKKKKNAVWCIEWSGDGRYLAAGGKDGVVRVWEVLKTPEGRFIAATSDGYGGETSQQLKPDQSSPAKVRPCPPTSTASSQSTSARKKTSLPPKPANVMPVFNPVPIREYAGHEADVLDLSWSKNNFLLSSSMDKTVRLWHISRNECLCAFQHLDFVTSIAFHPKDDRYFLSGSLDCKLRLWDVRASPRAPTLTPLADLAFSGPCTQIPNRRVQIWTELPELITSVAFSRDGKLSIAGSFNGQCIFFETESFQYHSQFAAKSSRGKNSKGRKVTSMFPYPLPSSSGERLLVTSNDSRIRLYHTNDKAVEAKYAGHENTSSQIRASFSGDGKYVISGSEDRCVYIWDSGVTAERDEATGWNPLKKAKEGAGYEWFTTHIVTCASFAPILTREVLSDSGDPIFGDGHTHLIPLEQTVPGTSLGDESVAHLRSVNTRASAASVVNAANDAIIVVADDATGLISVFRNSKISIEASNRRMSRSSAH
ncbi:BZ3500_MvSof-1268-A1-R1_Chr3-3g06434 [Microbotryum saponariae]|uniref:BZ3500_MvSof-1268-A1-R1_Chr3-3g06434 protein n=1 Tax=Microbotryum saponariae TaxID=289078 RepID=A0A2X0L0Q3_9BASI|nr:BZ3500_MvSof-1268-A1-R1_Chr3-3g06434 [Microbotryum saponariae]SDA04401.1 BZ3501_MvSof-1269-A2-R1_Chr3-2g06121 [Microbotryum saponariae]